MADSLYQIRQHRLLEGLDRLGLDALILNPGPTLAYLTGLHLHLNERPVVAIIRPDGAPAVVLPSFEASKLEELPFELRSYTYGETPSTWERTFRNAARETRLDYRRVGLEPQRMRVLELRLIEDAAPRAAYLDGREAVYAVRARKNDQEIERIRQAVKVAETAVEGAIEALRPGITEIELASELTACLYRAGSEFELPFSPIVAFAESTARPHAEPSDRALSQGDPILCDWGAAVGGYVSDMTRMFSYGAPDRQMSELVDLVVAANRAAIEAARPDGPAADVDRAARRVIEEAGYGPQFVHRTGHGLGLDVHEPPYIRGDSHRVLRPGMVFTVEPGIYLPGRGGARIEDVVVVTDDGVETLTSLERTLVNAAERAAIS